MKVSIDKAGRVVVPKPLREQLGIVAGTPLEMELVDDHLELSPRNEPARVIQGPNGPVVAATGVSVGDADVRRQLDAARARG